MILHRRIADLCSPRRSVAQSDVLEPLEPPSRTRAGEENRRLNGRDCRRQIGQGSASTAEDRRLEHDRTFAPYGSKFEARL